MFFDGDDRAQRLAYESRRESNKCLLQGRNQILKPQRFADLLFGKKKQLRLLKAGRGTTVPRRPERSSFSSIDPRPPRGKSVLSSGAIKAQYAPFIALRTPVACGPKHAKLEEERKMARLKLPPWWRLLAFLVVLATISALLAQHHLHAYALGPASIAALFVCFLLLLACALAPGVPTIRQPLARWLAPIPAVGLVALWCVPYLIYAAGTGDFRWMAVLRLVVFAVPPLAVYKWLPVSSLSKLCWQDAAVAVFLIAGVLSGELKGVWNVPLNLDFMARLFVITVAGWSFAFVRPVPELRYELVISRNVFKAAALNFVYFAVIALPAGLALHFIRWNPRWKGPLDFLFAYAEIFLFIALLEELFFRGFLQSLLSTSLGSAWRGQLIVACLFGLFHILHAPFPNWRYVALASVAGWFYGTAFRNSGILASALTHAMVDTVWRTWLSAN
jgi:membrane protease YdiL (CAAX protease family)